jgi:TonB family protein
LALFHAGQQHSRSTTPLAIASTVLVSLVSAAGSPSFSLSSGRSFQSSLVRVAVVGLVGSTSERHAGQVNSLNRSLTEALARDSQIALVAPELVAPVLVGIGYEGSINLSTQEARRLGAAVGCDYFVVGKSEVLARSDRSGELHQEAIAGVMIVDGRTGKLIAFDFLVEQAANTEAALSALSRALASRAASYPHRMVQHYMDAMSPEPKSLATAAEGSPDPLSAGSASRGKERVEDLPDEDSPHATGIKRPEFLNRIKPEYPEDAARADIDAVIEARVVLRSNGEIGEIEIIRWAGFGLEDAAIRAIRQLKFRPATRDGRPISVRANLQYNFRRVSAR